MSAVFCQASGLRALGSRPLGSLRAPLKGIIRVLLKSSRRVLGFWLGVWGLGF